MSPDDRVRAERRALGLDHAAVGGLLARRWRLPSSLAAAIELHHSPTASGGAGLLRLADMLAHYAHDRCTDPAAIVEAARAAGVGAKALRAVMHEVPGHGDAAARRITRPSPLTPRERDVIRGLAEGKVYKQIAADLHLAPTTIRSHLHNAYRKLGSADRAQAVLAATREGWL